MAKNVEALAIIGEHALITLVESALNRMNEMIGEKSFQMFNERLTKPPISSEWDIEFRLCAQRYQEKVGLATAYGVDVSLQKAKYAKIFKYYTELTNKQLVPRVGPEEFGITLPDFTEKEIKSARIKQ